MTLDVASWPVAPPRNAGASAVAAAFDPGLALKDLDECDVVLHDENALDLHCGWPELVEHEGPQLYGSGDGLTLMGFLLWHYPGEIEVRWPKRKRRERPDDGALPPSQTAQSAGFIERITDAFAWKRSIRSQD